MASNFEVDWLARTMGSMTTLTWPERFDGLRKAILATSFAQNNEERFNSWSSRIDQFIERVENDRVSEPDMEYVKNRVEDLLSAVEKGKKCYVLNGRAPKRLQGTFEPDEVLSGLDERRTSEAEFHRFLQHSPLPAKAAVVPDPLIVRTSATRRGGSNSRRATKLRRIKQSKGYETEPTANARPEPFSFSQSPLSALPSLQRDLWIRAL